MKRFLTLAFAALFGLTLLVSCGNAKPSKDDAVTTTASGNTLVATTTEADLVDTEGNTSTHATTVAETELTTESTTEATTVVTTVTTTIATTTEPPKEPSVEEKLVGEWTAVVDYSKQLLSAVSSQTGISADFFDMSKCRYSQIFKFYIAEDGTLQMERYAYIRDYNAYQQEFKKALISGYEKHFINQLEENGMSKEDLKDYLNYIGVSSVEELVESHWGPFGLDADGNAKYMFGKSEQKVVENRLYSVEDGKMIDCYVVFEFVKESELDLLSAWVNGTEQYGYPIKLIRK